MQYPQLIFKNLYVIIIYLISPKFILNLFGTWESVFWRLETRRKPAKTKTKQFKIIIFFRNTNFEIKTPDNAAFEEEKQVRE